MYILFIRTIFLYIFVIIILRLMGKRQIGELQPYEFVITIMVSDLAAMPMQDIRIPLISGVFPIITLLLVKLSLSHIQLKSQFARKVIDGEPSILIYKNKINYKALKDQQINIDELMEEIRLAGYFDLEEICYAILETNGSISILPRGADEDPSSKKFDLDYPNRHVLEETPSTNTPKANSKPKEENCSPKEFEDVVHDDEVFNLAKPTPAEARKNPNLKNGELYLPKILVSDGKINRNSLTKPNKDDAWIKETLKSHGIEDIKKVLIALYDTQGVFKYQLYDQFEKECLKDEK